MYRDHSSITSAGFPNFQTPLHQRNQRGPRPPTPPKNADVILERKVYRLPTLYTIFFGRWIWRKCFISTSSAITNLSLGGGGGLRHGLINSLWSYHQFYLNLCTFFISQFGFCLFKKGISIFHLHPPPPSPPSASSASWPRPPTPPKRADVILERSLRCVLHRFNIRRSEEKSSGH